MDISYLVTPTQMMLAWILSGMLLIWLIIFAAMAFWREAVQPVDIDDLPTPARSFPSVHVHVQAAQAPAAAPSINVPGAPGPSSYYGSPNGSTIPETSWENSPTVVVRATKREW